MPRARLSAPARPSAKYGNYLHLGNDEPLRTPMFAYSHRELDQLLEQRLASARHLFGEQTLDQIRETYANMHRELTAMKRRRKAFDRQSGLSDAYQVQAAALDREVDAAARLVLTAPASCAEATLKRRYMQRLGGTEWWMCQSHRDRIMQLCR